MGFSRQEYQSGLLLPSPPKPVYTQGKRNMEYWSGLLFPSPGDLPDPGIESSSPTLQVDSLPSEPPGKPGTQCTPSHILGHTKPDPEPILLWEETFRDGGQNQNAH